MFHVCRIDGSHLRDRGFCVITRRVSCSSVVAQVCFSSFSTLGTSISARSENDVVIHLTALGANRVWVGGTSAVTSASGYLLTSAGSTSLHLRNGDQLWAITSAAATSTVTALYTNQPV